MVYKQKTSKNWWYKFVWNGEVVRESTKQANKRVAEQMEAAHRTRLAKGEVGIRDRKTAPTLEAFADSDFLPYVRTTSAGKPNTVRFYQNSVNNLKSVPALATLRMDAITSENISAYVAKRQADKVTVATVNRELATMRRMFHLSQEWGKVEKVLPRVKLLPGENRRERVLTAEEETAYLEAATAIGDDIQHDYQRALTGIRAVKRGQQPRCPDAYLLRTWPRPWPIARCDPKSVSGCAGRTTSGMAQSRFTPAKGRVHGAECQRLNACWRTWKCVKVSAKMTAGFSQRPRRAAISKHPPLRSSTRGRSRLAVLRHSCFTRCGTRA